MGAQSISNLDRIDLCKVVDEWLSCQWGRYMRYHRYRIGDKPDISYWGKIIRLHSRPRPGNTVRSCAG